MDNEQIKEYVKEHLADFLEMNSIKTKGFFTCINPQHNDHNPSMRIDRKKNKAHCFGCHADYDTFDAIGIFYGLTDFKDQFNKAIEIFNLEQDMPTGKKHQEKPVAKPVDHAKTEYAAKIAQNALQTDNVICTVDFTYDIEKAAQNLKLCKPALDYFKSRGLTDEIITKYKLGYMERGYSEIIENHQADLTCKVKPNAHLYPYIFPYLKNGKVNNLYVEIKDRNKTNEYSKKYDNPLKGYKKELYNEQYLLQEQPPRYLFIVEGIYDALSIEVAGGKAIALVGTGYNRFLEIIKNRHIDTNFIISLDNDLAGTAAAKKLNQELYEMGISRILEQTPPKYGKDANDFLVKDKAALIKWVHDTEYLFIADYLATNAATDIKLLEDKIIGRQTFNCLPTGYRRIDEKLDGGLYAGLYIMGAVSSMGKTTQLLQMADQLAARGQDILFISLEQSKYELMTKSISRLTYIQELVDQGILTSMESTRLQSDQLPDKIKNAQTLRYLMNISLQDKWNDTTREKVEQAYTYYREHIGLREWIKEGVGNISALQIRGYVEQHIKVTGRKPILFIDYLQILAPKNEQVSRGSDKRIIDANVNELKLISRDFNIPIVAVSSFNRENYNTAITMLSYNGSGAIEYGSDILWGLQPTGLGDTERAKVGNKRIVEQEKDKNIRTLDMVMLKNRNGSTANKHTYFKFIPAYNCYLEVTEQEDTRLEIERKRIERKLQKAAERIEHDKFLEQANTVFGSMGTPVEDNQEDADMPPADNDQGSIFG